MATATDKLQWELAAKSSSGAVVTAAGVITFALWLNQASPTPPAPVEYPVVLITESGIAGSQASIVQWSDSSQPVSDRSVVEQMARVYDALLHQEPIEPEARRILSANRSSYYF